MQTNCSYGVVDSIWWKLPGTRRQIPSRCLLHWSAFPRFLGYQNDLRRVAFPPLKLIFHGKDAIYSRGKWRKRTSAAVKPKTFISDIQHLMLHVSGLRSIPALQSRLWPFKPVGQPGVRTVAVEFKQHAPGKQSGNTNYVLSQIPGRYLVCVPPRSMRVT